MAWTCKQVTLAVVMVITGSINTLSTKWADRQSALGTAVKEHGFDHPFFQAVGMFLGEMMCMAVFLVMFCAGRTTTIRREQTYFGLGYNPFIFLPAALCDMCGTSLMYIGLNLTYASSFQMLRGAVIIFYVHSPSKYRCRLALSEKMTPIFNIVLFWFLLVTGAVIIFTALLSVAFLGAVIIFTALLSVAFLGRTIKVQMWVGIVAVILGLAVVGLSDIIFNTQKDKDTNGIIAGDLLIIMAQIIVSVQMVYEERVINRYTIHPLEAVGWEGIFGFTCLGLLLIPFYYIDAGAFSKLPSHKLDDAIDAFHQLGQNPIILTATLGNIFSIAFFNFAGISITREISATTRMVLDSIRTLFIWIVTLLLAWRTFIPLQVLGFLFLLAGMMLYNDVGIDFIKRKIIFRILRREVPPGDDQERLIQENRGNIQDSEQGPSFRNAVDT